MTDTHELAWAAGFFDGEGCAMCRNRSKEGRKRSLKIEIQQMRREPLDRFKEATGGLGSIHQDGRGCWRYQTVCGNAEKVQALLWPYLSVPSREKFERAVALVQGVEIASP